MARALAFHNVGRDLGIFHPRPAPLTRAITVGASKPSPTRRTSYPPVHDSAPDCDR